MATQIDWGLLRQAPNIAESFAQGQALGELQQRKKATQDILAGYAANPKGPVPNALAIYDPQAYAALSQNSRQQAVADRQTADALRQTQARTLGAGYLRQNEPVGVAHSAPAATGSNAAQVDPNGDIIVTGNKPAAPAAPRIDIADVFEKDPELAKNLTDHMAAMSKADRENFGQKTGVAAAVSLAALNVAPDQRQAFLDDHAPLLKQAGWTDRELMDFDPTDDNLHGMAAVGVGADKYLADLRQEKGQQVTVRGQDVSAATARRGQDISASTTRRGQDISAATASAGQAVTMRGQDMAAAGRAAPPKATVALARNKLSSLTALETQLNRAEAALRKAKYTGPIAGRLPGGISGADSAADAAIANLAPLVRQLTRVPGEGAMSDYESRLAQAGLPSRSQTVEGRKQSLDDIRALVAQTKAGYSDLVGDSPAPAARGFKVMR
ncbi:hypothetical protein [Sphingomonas melonis]|uniref:Uncharacterized protein n=1 Tax=Sphingomonas melonis TaxID=152682 RepID=A0A7Y9K1B3_9SPHN|nr:hypothetical protein [Sphingomonas melonis]NYD88744.1 hypothetical protein [Sphingomonas melonis]